MVAAWKHDKVDEALAAKANEIRDRLAKGEDIAKVAGELSLEVKTADKLTRATAGGRPDRRRRQGAFAGPKGSAAVAPGRRRPVQDRPPRHRCRRAALFLRRAGPRPGQSADSSADHQRPAAPNIRPTAKPGRHEAQPDGAAAGDRPGRAATAPDSEAEPMLVEPAAAEFARAYDAGEAQVVWTRLVADLETPVSAMLKLSAGRANCFLLESVEGGAVRGRYSIIGIEPDLIFRAFGAKAEINADPQAGRDRYEPMPEPTLQALRRLIGESRIELPDGLPPMSAGIFGYLGYDMVRADGAAAARPSPTRSASPTRS